MTLPEAAASLGLRARLLQDAARRGRLRTYRLGGKWHRTTAQDVEQWLEDDAAAQLDPTSPEST